MYPVTLVLLPGMDGTGRLFGSFRDALGDRAALSVVSYPTDRRLSYNELEELVISALPREAPYVLVAESFSGPVAVRIASRRPAGLRGVVLCASFVKRPAPRWLARFAWALQSGASLGMLRLLLMSRDSPAHLVHAVSDAIRSVHADVLRGRLKDALQVDVGNRLSACDVPFLYVAGSRDRLLGRRGLRQIAELKQDVRQVLVDGPHLLLQCCSAEVVAAIMPSIREWID